MLKLFSKNGVCIYQRMLEPPENTGQLKDEKVLRCWDMIGDTFIFSDHNDENITLVQAIVGKDTAYVNSIEMEGFLSSDVSELGFADDQLYITLNG